MKNRFSKTRMGLAVTGAILSLGLLLSACTKNDYNDSNNAQVAALMAFNLIADKQGINITLSNNVLPTGQLQYNDYTVSYLNIYPGNRSIQAYDVAAPGTPITNSDFAFETKKYYSLFVVGANNVYRNVVSLDNYDSLSATNGQAYVRYINAIPDSSNPKVTLSVNGANISDLPAHFTTVSQFTPVAPGNITVSVTNEGNIQASRTIAVEAKKVYTVLLTGKPGDTDPAKQVQVKFIQNGNLTP